jgi:aryl-alcohol dehydrogenase-like predicted oxidoreductase
MGLGCGGHSRLGMARGENAEEASRIVREAIDLGVTLIDTAEAYGTEKAVGLGIRGLPRESVVLSTKIGLDRRPMDEAQFRERFERCLARLGTEYVDVLHLHGALPEQYDHAREVLYPAMVRLKGEGKVRHLGITEQFIPDPGHRMLEQAVQDGLWEVVMVGFSLLNPSARERVFPVTQEKGIGTLDMFAVRRALSDGESLRTLVRNLVEAGTIEGRGIDLDDPLGFVGPNLQDAAYRFCLHEPGVDVVLSGTGNSEHLRQNVRSLSGPPLPEDVRTRLRAIFGAVDSVTGNEGVPRFGNRP